MSSYDPNSNPNLTRALINQYKHSEEQAKKAPDSILPAFESELHQLGFQFEVLNQIGRAHV